MIFMDRGGRSTMGFAIGMCFGWNGRSRWGRVDDGDGLGILRFLGMCVLYIDG